MSIRIGLVGAGAVAEYHAAAARSTAQTRLAAVCDLKEDAAERIVGTTGARVFTDYRSMLDSGLIDAVIVNTPHSLHVPMAVAAAERGLHVLVEKPMATTSDGCAQIVSACRSAGVKVVVGHIQHFLPDKVAAFEALSSGVLGRPVLIRDYRTTDYRPGTRPDWFFARDVAGGGAMMNIGGHCLDRCLWFGGAPAKRITARLEERFGVPVETDGVMNLELTNGIPVSITVVSDTPQRTDEMVIVCENGVLTVDPRNGSRLQVDGQMRVLSRPDPADIPLAFTRQFEDFVAVIRGSAPAVPVEHAWHVVELVEAAYDSARLGESVTLSGQEVAAVE